MYALSLEIKNKVCRSEIKKKIMKKPHHLKSHAVIFSTKSKFSDYLQPIKLRSLK